VTLQLAVSSLPETRETVVSLDGVSMSYGRGPLVLDGIDLQLHRNEFLSIVGPSGCGKSTILRLISGMASAAAGTVSVRGKQVTGVPEGIGFMFQRDALLPWATVAENIAIALDCAHVQRPEHAGRIDELLRILGLSGYGNYYPRALSGGMRQRVSLGRLLAYTPDIYLMDEPFGALDAQTKLLMGRELLRIWSEYRRAVIFVTHDIEEAVSLADRVIVMTGRPGRIKREYSVDYPRPRDLRAIRKDTKFHRIVDAIWSDITETNPAA